MATFGKILISRRTDFRNRQNAGELKDTFPVPNAFAFKARLTSFVRGVTREATVTQ